MGTYKILSSSEVLEEGTDDVEEEEVEEEEGGNEVKEFEGDGREIGTVSNGIRWEDDENIGIDIIGGGGVE